MKTDKPVFTMDKHIVLNPSLTLAEKGLIALISAFDERGISTEEIKMYCPLDDCEAIMKSAKKKLNDVIEVENNYRVDLIQDGSILGYTTYVTAETKDEAYEIALKKEKDKINDGWHIVSVEEE